MEYRTYTCACCGNTYRSGRTEEEAEREYNERFSGYEPVEQAASVCEHCYEEIMKAVLG